MIPASSTFPGRNQLAGAIASLKLIPLSFLVLLMMLGQVAVPGADLPMPTPSTWPIFRGTPQLTGMAPGTLTDSPKLLWKAKIGETKSSPIVYQGVIFIGTDEGKVLALKLEDGKPVWELNVVEPVEAAPLYLDGCIYVGDTKGILHALDAKTGKSIWRYETGNKILGSANWTESTNHDKIILAGSYDNIMHGVDAKTGKRIYAYETQNFINGAPAISDGKAVFGGCDAHLHVISARDGSLLADIPAGSYIAGSAALDGPLVYVGHYGNQLLCADIDKKTILWSYGDKDNGSPFFASPALAQDRLVAGSRDNRIHCINRADGTKLWIYKTQGDIDASPVICDGKVVAGSTDGRLYLLSLKDGKVLWKYETGAPIIGSPAVVDGRIIVAVSDGQLLTFGKK